jgi:ParB-like chromosome segregation protein Spo0J
VRQTEDIVRRYKENKKKPVKAKPDTSSEQIHLNRVGEELTERFGNKVRLSQKTNGQGEINISFSSTKDLNRILRFLEE